MLNSLLVVDMTIYIIEMPNQRKAYLSFSRLCKENRLELKKEMLPVRVASLLVYKVEVDDRL